MSAAWKQYEGQIADGKYHLREYLGGGEWTAVFRTEVADAKRSKAAIKIIPAEGVNAELQLARWRQAAKLTHPNLLKLYEAGQCQFGDAWFLYVVMEFADEDLSQILPQRPLTPEETRGMLGSVLDALAFLHDKAYVHGHLKPANVMAIKDRVKLSTDGVFRAGELVGGSSRRSPYDPPEAAKGRLSTAADIWSLGVTLAEVLTQRLPVWERLGHEEPKLPEKIPAPYAEIAGHCLCREPLSRWTVEKIAERLEHTLAVPVAQPAPVPQAKKSVSRPNYLVAAGAIGLALVAIVIVPKMFRHVTKAQPAAEVSSEPTAVEAKPEPVRETTEKAKPPKKKEERTRVVAEAPSSPASAQPASTKAEQAAPVNASRPVEAKVAGGEVTHQVVPNVPQKAMDTIHGTLKVSVRVAVDASGNVADATLDVPGPSKYFANLAMKAARQWTFSPVNAEGQSAPSEWILRFEFTNTATRVSSVRAPAAH